MLDDVTTIEAFGLERRDATSTFEADLEDLARFFSELGAHDARGPDIAEEWYALTFCEMAVEALATRLAKLAALLGLKLAASEVAAEVASTRAPPLNLDLLSSPWSHRGPPTPLAGGSRNACTQRRRRRKIEAVPLS